MMKKCIVFLLLLSAACWAGLDNDPNLMIHYEFETGLVADSTGNYPGGVATAQVVWATDAPLQLSLNGKGTKSGDFSHSDAYIAIAGTESDFNLDTLSIAVWMKGAPIDGWRPIVAKYGESGKGWQFRRGGNNPANLSLTLRGVGNEDGNSNVPPELQTDEWHHYAATHDPAIGTTIYYVDGAHFQTLTGRFGTVNDTTAPLAISARIKEDLGVDSKGEIPGLDDVRVFNRVLTPEEIKELCPPEAMRAQVTNPTDGFVGFIDYTTENIEWTAPTEGIVDGYNVWMAPDGGAWQLVDANIVAPLETAFPVWAAQDTTYSARVDVVDPNGYIIVGTPVSWFSSASPSMVTQPQQMKDPVPSGSNPAWYCLASDPASAPLSYQWYADGQPIDGATSDKLVWHDAKPMDHATELYCIASSVNGSIQSDTVRLLVQTCIAQYTFDDPIMPGDDPNFPPIGKESRFGYDCYLHGPITGIGNDIGPDASNAISFNSSADSGLIADIKPNSNDHFTDYADRMFVTLSFWMKGWPTNDGCSIVGIEGDQGWDARRRGTDLNWSTRDHDRDGDKYGDYSSQSSDGEWHHVAMFFGPNDDPQGGNGYDRGDKAIFVDGVRIMNENADFNRPGINVDDADMRFAIGLHVEHLPNGIYNPVGGGVSLDDVRVYNYALSPKEIIWLSQNPGSDPDCLGIDGDVNGDCVVDLDDLSIEAQNWLISK